MKIALPDSTGRLANYTLTGSPLPETRLPSDPARIVYSAAHVVADPFTVNDPSGPAAVPERKLPAFSVALQTEAQAVVIKVRTSGGTVAVALPNPMVKATPVTTTGAPDRAAIDLAAVEMGQSAHLCQGEARRHLSVRIVTHEAIRTELVASGGGVHA